MKKPETPPASIAPDFDPADPARVDQEIAQMRKDIAQMREETETIRETIAKVDEQMTQVDDLFEADRAEDEE